MKVLHVIPSIGARYGGPSQALRQMVQGLAGLEVEVEVVTTTADGSKELNVPLDRPVDQMGVPFHYFPRQSPKWWTFSWPLTRWVRENTSRFDIVHVHALFSYPSLAASRAAARTATPFILRPLGTLSPWSLAHHAWRKKPYYWLFEKQSLEEAAAIHATSQQEALSITALGFGDKTSVIPLGVELPDVPKRSFSTARPLRLLFLSRLDPIKGAHHLIQAVEALKTDLPGIELVVAGDGEPGYRAELEREVRRLHLDASVHFTGLLEGKSKEQVLAEADIFVLPSYHESFGIAVTEAMAWGLPVVITDAVAIDEDVRAADAGLVSQVGSSQALAEAILELAEPEKRRTKGVNARRLVEQRFSRETMADSLAAFYGKTIEGTQARIASRGAE